MSHQVRLCSDRAPTVTGLSLDSARAEAARLSGQHGGRWVVELVDGWDKTVRSIGLYGRVHWAVLCPVCKGKPAPTYYYGAYCSGCMGIGKAPDYDAWDGEGLVAAPEACEPIVR